MKKHILKLVSILIAPYWICFGMSRAWFYFDRDWVFVLFLISMPFAALLSSIYLIVYSSMNNLNTPQFSFINFVIKLLHIPAFIFLLRYLPGIAGPQPNDIDWAYNFAIFLNSISVFITGLLAIATIIAFLKKQKHAKTMIVVLVILGLGQFIIIIDVLAALILLIISFISKRKDKQKMSTNQVELA